MRYTTAGSKGKLNLPRFQGSNDSFEATYGLADLLTVSEGIKGRTDIEIPVGESHHFAKSKRILIYNVEQGRSEINSTIRYENGTLYLQNELSNYYACNSIFIWQQAAYLETQSGWWKIHRPHGRCQWFYVTHFPEANSVLYRIEVEKKKQIRGYIFLLNLV